MHNFQNDVGECMCKSFIANIGIFVVHEEEIHEVTSHTNELCTKLVSASGKLRGDIITSVSAGVCKAC